MNHCPNLAIAFQHDCLMMKCFPFPIAKQCVAWILWRFNIQTYQFYSSSGVNWNSGTEATINFFMRSNVASSWPGSQTAK